jgi:hypothetical protein
MIESPLVNPDGIDRSGPIFCRRCGGLLATRLQDGMLVIIPDWPDITDRLVVPLCKCRFRGTASPGRAS